MGHIRIANRTSQIVHNVLNTKILTKSQLDCIFQHPQTLTELSV